MDNKPVRIIIVDDYPLIRATWKLLLQNHPSFEIVGECGTGKDAIELTRQLVPDVMLLDLNMFPLNGFDIAEIIAEFIPYTKIIGLSVNDTPKNAVRLIELGAMGYLTKTSTLEEICHGIMEVHNGNFYICEEIIHNIAEGEPMTGKIFNKN